MNAAQPQLLAAFHDVCAALDLFEQIKSDSITREKVQAIRILLSAATGKLEVADTLLRDQKPETTVGEA